MNTLNYQGQNKKSKLDLAKVVQDYFDRMLQEVPGLKCLVLDKETTGIISLICTQSQILKKDVYLIEQIEDHSIEKMKHMKAIYFLRPNERNLNKIKKEIENPRFCEYYLFFSNLLNVNEIERIAEVDMKNEVVKQIQEIYADYYVINPDFFTLNIESTIGLSRIKQSWNEEDKQNLQRISDGIYATLLSLRRNPMIRYLGSSDACSQLAEKLTERMKTEYGNIREQFDRENRTLLLILDRREDPVTPVLNQWTYQAMIHELIGIHDNRVDLRTKEEKEKNMIPKNPSEINEFVLSCQSDAFFYANMYLNFGDFAENIKSFIDKLGEAREKTVKIESLEDMQAALDKLPELKQMTGNVQKHVTLSNEISNEVKKRELMEVSQVEQEIATKDNRMEHSKAVWDLLHRSDIKMYEKIRLVLLYALRYENDDKIGKMLNKLRDDGAKQTSLNLITNTLEYAGKSKRSGDLFSDKNLMEKAKLKMKQYLRNVPNVYQQHQPYINSLISQIQKGSLKESEYPTTNNYLFKEKPNEILIFIMGGVTYEEAREIGIINRNESSNLSIILGGTDVLNSKKFFTEITRFYSDKKEIDIGVYDSTVQPNQKHGFHKMD